MFKRTAVVALAMLMSLTLVICMAPSSDAVDQGTMPTKIVVGSEEIDIENGETIEMGGGTVTYDPSSNTLILNDATIVNTTGTIDDAAVSFDNDLKIHLEGSNTINSVCSGIRSDDGGTLIIDGGENSTLTIDSVCYGIRMGGFSSTGVADMTINGASIDITTVGKDSRTGVGIQAEGNLHVSGSGITVDAQHEGLIGNAGVSVSRSYVSVVSTEYEAMLSNYGVSISEGSDIHIESESIGIRAGEDYSGKVGPITISDSRVTANTYDASIYTMMGDISITGSEVSVSSESNNCIFSKSELVVSQSEIDAIGHWPALRGATGLSVVGSDVLARSTNDVAIYSQATISIIDSNVDAISDVSSAIMGVESLKFEGDSKVSAQGAEGSNAVVGGSISIVPQGVDVDIWFGADEQSAEKMEGSPFSEPFITDSIDVSYFLYEVHDPYSDLPPIIWDDDDEYVPPIVPVQGEDSGDDDTVTVVACAAAAVVAALIAAFLILDRRH